MQLYHRGKPVWRYCSLPAGGAQCGFSEV